MNGGIVNIRHRGWRELKVGRFSMLVYIFNGTLNLKGLMKWHMALIFITPQF